MAGDTFSERLRAAIKARGTQSAFAERMGVREATVSDWVQGRNAPGFDQLLRIVETLGVDAHWLLTGRGEMVPARRDAIERAFEVIAGAVDEARATGAGEAQTETDALAWEEAQAELEEEARRQRRGRGTGG